MMTLLGVLFVIAGAVLGMYVGIYKMIIVPIVALCVAISAGTVTTLLVASVVLKVLFAGTVGYLIFTIFYVIGYVLMSLKF